MKFTKVIIPLQLKNVLNIFDFILNSSQKEANLKKKVIKYSLVQPCERSMRHSSELP